MSIKYLPDRKLPDKAIDLIDEASSKVKMSSTSKPIELDKLEKEILSIKIKLEALKNEESKDSPKLLELEKEIANKQEILSLKLNKWMEEKNNILKVKELKEKLETLKSEADKKERDSDFQEVARLRYWEIPKIQNELNDLNEKLEKIKNEGDSYLKDKVDIEEIADIISKWSWVPVGKLVESDKEKYIKLNERLKHKVIGQEKALDSISEAIQRNKAGLNDETKPIWSFLFLWPTGVWKTETAKALAEELFNDRNAFIRIDMSEYGEAHTVSRLIGSPPGYVWHDEGGQLTELVRRKPYSVILFDEIEKAHREVFNVFLQILDEWRLTDWKWRTINFKNTIIIMTSNLASQIISDDSVKDVDKEVKIFNELKLFFKPELLNRIDDIVIYNKLTKKELINIVDLLLNDIKAILLKKNIQIEFSKELKTYLMEQGFNEEFWARPLKRFITKFILNNLSLKILSWELKEQDSVKASVKDGKLIIEK